MNNHIQISTFNFHKTSIRTFAKDGEVWFLANDVCQILGYANPRQAVQKNCKIKGVSIIDTLTKGGNQSMVYINEPNLYRLIIKSRKLEAEAFESWVFEKILPSIRQTGSYGDNQALLTQNQALKAELLKFNPDYKAIKVMHDGGLENWQIAQAVNLSRSTVSKKLTHLRRLGLVSQHKPQQQLALFGGSDE